MHFQNLAMFTTWRAMCVVLLVFISTQAYAVSFTVVNNEELPLEMTVQHRNHCFQTSDPNAVNGKTTLIPPKGELKLGFWHAGDWRGCGGTAGEFVLVFSPSVKVGSIEKDKVGFWFDRGQGFGMLTTVYPNHFPGKLTKVGGDNTFTTDAHMDKVHKIDADGYWDQICDGSCTKSTTKTVTESSANKNSVTKEQSSAIASSLTLGAEGGGFSASVSISAEQKDMLSRTMESSFEKGLSETNVLDFSQYTAEKMGEWNINGIYQWVVAVNLSDGTKHTVRSPIFRCVSSTRSPSYSPFDQLGVGSCTGGLAEQANAQVPVGSNTAAARGFELFWDGKKVNGPEADRFTLEQAKQSCSQNRRAGVKIECRFNGTTFYME